MAAQPRDVGHGRLEVKFRKRIYETLWVIPDWIRVQQTEESLSAQTFHFEIGKSRRVKTKWEVGFSTMPTARKFAVYCKLIDFKGFPAGKIQSTISAALSQANSTFFDYGDTRVKTFDLGQTLLISYFLSFEKTAFYWRNYVDRSGDFTIKLNIDILEPETHAVIDMKMEEFHKTSVEKFSANFTAIFNDKSTADLKIVTSDKKELWAHKIILKVQCPVFDSMFCSKMSEDQTGVVDVQDITGKTMSIFLHYFYSGKLLPTWKDEDTVVEFTYAAGKYQLTGILELLNDVLGTRDEEDATQTDVLLLDLAAKLGLKNAEKELLERVVDKTNKAKSRDELFGLYGLGNS